MYFASDTLQQQNSSLRDYPSRKSYLRSEYKQYQSTFHPKIDKAFSKKTPCINFTGIRKRDHRCLYHSSTYPNLSFPGTKLKSSRTSLIHFCKEWIFPVSGLPQYVDFIFLPLDLHLSLKLPLSSWDQMCLVCDKSCLHAPAENSPLL